MANWQQIRDDYDRSVLDWHRINAFATKVAAELGRREPHNTSWTLASRYSRRVEKTRSYTETSRSAIDYLLLRDGSLVVEVTTWTEMINPSYWETPKETLRRPFDVDCVKLFDFERKYYLSRDQSVESDRDPGNKLLVHAKGVGLTKRLKELLGSQ